MLIIHTASTFILKDIRQTKYSSPKRLLMFVAMGCFLWIWKPSRIFFNHQHLQSTKLKLLLVHLIISIQTTGVCSFSVALLCKTKWRTALFSFPPCWQTCLLYFLWKWIIKSVKHNEKKKRKTQLNICFSFQFIFTDNPKWVNLPQSCVGHLDRLSTDHSLIE